MVHQIKICKFTVFSSGSFCQYYRVTDEALIAQTIVWPNFFLMNVFFALKGPKNILIIKLLNSEFRIPTSEFRILNSENSEFRVRNPNSEFRILNSAFRKKVVDGNFVLEMPHQGPCTGWGKGSNIRTIQTIVYM